MRLDLDVKRLMKTHGYPVTLTRVQSGGTYDTATGTISGGQELTWSGRGVFTNYRDEDIDGTSITSDDRRLLLQALGLEREPENGDYVDNEVRIVNARKIRSGDVVIGYVCQTRG